MDLYERIKIVAKNKGVSINQMEKDLHFARSYIAKLRTVTPSSENMSKIAKYLNVNVEYLYSGSDESDFRLNSIDQKDIAKDLSDIMKKLEDGDDAPLNFNGQSLDSESKRLLRNALELGLTQLKIKNKELYNPNKNKDNK